MPLDKAALESLRLDHGSEPQRYQDSPARRVRWLIVAAVAAAIAAVVAWWVLNSAVPVQTAMVETAAGAADGAVLNASGYVVARRIATVCSKVTGRVSEVRIDEGARVKQGQVLATLDPATARAEYNLTNRSLEASRRSLREIQVRIAYPLSPCAGETRPLRSRQSHVTLWQTSRPIAGE